MKRFLIKTVVFSAVVIVIALGLDRMICSGLLQMDDYRFQDYRAMLDGGMDNEVLIMGNSRGKSHFDPYIIDSVCNTSSFCIGAGGYPINLHRAKYRLYKEHNSKPHIIVQNVDHMTLNVHHDVRHQHQSEQFFPLVYDPVGRKELRSIGYGFLELNVPLYRMFGYQMDIKNGLMEFLHLKHYVSRPAYKGFRAEEGGWNGTELENMEVREIELSQEGRSAFESLMEEFRSDSVSVVLVYSPMYEGVKEKLIGLEKANGYFEDVARRFGFHFLDYSDIDICKDSSNFCVSIHMNPTATKAFTERFSEDLLELGLL